MLRLRMGLGLALFENQEQGGREQISFNLLSLKLLSR